MAKIVLGKRPKTFESVVTFPMLEGGEGSVKLTFTYRTRSEFGAMVDGLMAEAGVTAKGADEEAQKFSLKEAMEKTKEANADYIMKIAEGWDLEEPFNRGNVAQLCDEIPAAAFAMMNAYRSAITEGRLGN